MYNKNKLKLKEMKKRKMNSQTAKKIVRGAREHILYYKGKNKCYFSLRKIFERYRAYDLQYFYEKLKPYVLGEKDMSEIPYENFIEGIYDAKKRERIDLAEICKGDIDLFEKTYGYLPRF